MKTGVPTGLLTRERRLHFIGVGGAGMSGIAELCKRLGFRVSGCDLRESDTTRRLASLGVEIEAGHHPGHLSPGLDAVVISSAVKFSNPEVERARELRVPVIPRAEMLGELLRLAQVGIAVGGTHGKTTTTSLIGMVLEEAGLDPTVAIGGNLRSRGTNVRLGQGDFMVAEADESDASFLLLLPTVAVVTNIDPEHLDYYGSMDRVQEAYLNFVNRVPFYGFSVLGIDNATVRGLLPAVRKPSLTYGFTPEAEFRATDVNIEGLSTSFEVLHNGQRLGALTVPVPGHHVALNALASTAVALGLGVDFEHVRRALASFSGVSRRFELVGEAAGRLVLDDYAHHPEELKATLKAARAAFRRRIVAVFQPHRYTRTRDLFADFLGAFDLADRLYVLEVYSAGEEPMPGISGRRLYEALRARGHLDVHYLGEEPEPAAKVAAESARGDLVVTLGAGDVYRIGEKLLELLASEADVHGRV